MTHERDDEAGGPTPAEIEEAAWREAMTEALAEDGWQDDHMWATGPGPGYDDAEEWGNDR